MVADRVELVTRKAGSAPGVRVGVARRGHLHRSRRRRTRRRAPPSRCTSSPRTPTTRCTTTPNPATVRGDRQAVLGLHHLADPDGSGGATETVNSRKALWARPQKDVSDEEYAEFYRHVSHDWREPLKTIRLAGRGHVRVPGPAVPAQPRADGPVPARGQARRAALRQARVHHGRLRGARPRVPALRQGRRRRGRPVAQHLPRDPPAGPADPADPQAAGQEGAVDGQDDAGDEPEKYATFWSELGRAVKEGLLVRPRQPRRDPRDLLVPVDARPGEADDAARLPRAHARGPGRDLLRAPASRGRRWRTRRTWRRSAPRATRCCCSPTRSTRCGSTRCRRSRASRWTSIAKGEVDLGGDDVDDGARSRASPPC